MDATPNIKTQTGNRVLVEIAGQRVGLIQTVGADDDYGMEPASGIGDIHVQENVPTMARHTLNVSAMVLKTNSLRSLGILPENGDDVLKGLVFDIVYYDKDTNAILRKYTGCSVSRCSVEVQKHAIVATNATIVALDASGTGI
jgi:hypothetical protein